MKVAALLEQRRKNWMELDQLCSRVRGRNLTPDAAVRFTALYRAACADLALADAYQLPPNTVQFLHRLVGRAHNHLYRGRRFNFQEWGRSLLFDVPRRVFRDRCVQIAFLVFWATFLGSGLLAYTQVDWMAQVAPAGFADMLEESFKLPLGSRDPQENFRMAAFYIGHNTGIGLRCFVFGILLVPGMFELLNNALILGAAFGHMARPDVPEGRNFFEFVTAHGPFELTAIVLSSGAGLRLGFGWLKTNGLTRSASIRKTAREAVPLMAVAGVLFFLAALIEGFFSPLALPFVAKVVVAIFSLAVLIVYFLVLGFPRRAR